MKNNRMTWPLCALGALALCLASCDTATENAGEDAAAAQRDAADAQADQVRDATQMQAEQIRDAAKNVRLPLPTIREGRGAPVRPPDAPRPMVFHAGQPREIVEEMKRIWAERIGG